MGLSGLKGRVSAGDYRDVTSVEENHRLCPGFSLLYVFMVTEVHHSCQVCLDQPPHLHSFLMQEKVRVRKGDDHFLLLCVTGV